jgi:tripartite-type tricarboxylate transporter receptor subunit TctC
LPDVPTLAEAGLPGFDVSGWFGLFAPKGTPPDIVAKLNAETVKILNDPQFKQDFLNRGAITIGGSSEAFTKYAADERVRWAKIIADAKITLE